MKNINPVDRNVEINILIASVVVLIFTYLYVCLKCYGSINFIEAYRNYKSQKELEDAYDHLSQRREDLLYHIDWARQRNDFDGLKSLHEQLDDMIIDLDNMEEKLKLLDADGTIKKKEI